MIETLRNFTLDEIWALHRAISGEVTRLALLNESMSDEDKHLQATLVGLVPEINQAWEIVLASSYEDKLQPEVDAGHRM